MHRPRHLFVLKQVLIAVNGNQFKRDLHEYHYSTSCHGSDMSNWFFVSVEWSVSRGHTACRHASCHSRCLVYRHSLISSD